MTSSALSEQERSLAGLRTRAGTVLAAASIAGSFLGTESSRGPLNVWGALALPAFVLCASSAVWVLMAHRMVFAFAGEKLLAENGRVPHRRPIAQSARGLGVESNRPAVPMPPGVSSTPPPGFEISEGEDFLIVQARKLYGRLRSLGGRGRSGAAPDRHRGGRAPASLRMPQDSHGTTGLRYDPDVDIALISFETGSAIEERRDWGLIDRHPDDGHLMGFEIWKASKTFPAELLAALPKVSRPRDLAARDRRVSLSAGRPLSRPH